MDINKTVYPTACGKSADVPGLSDLIDGLIDGAVGRLIDGWFDVSIESLID